MPSSSCLPAVSISGGVCCNTVSAAGRHRCKGRQRHGRSAYAAVHHLLCAASRWDLKVPNQQLDNTPSCHSSGSPACSRSKCRFHLPLCAFIQLVNSVPASSCPSVLPEPNCWLPPLSCPAERERIVALAHPPSLPPSRRVEGQHDLGPCCGGTRLQVCMICPSSAKWAAGEPVRKKCR